MSLSASLMNYDDVILEAFQEARRVVQRVSRRGVAERPLGVGASGDVTFEVDRAAEAAILKVLQRRLSKFHAVTEESGFIGSSDDRPIVIIDPVDGSINASRGVPLYSSSIAIADGERFGDIVSAGVVNLVQGDVIIGGEGRGVSYNGKPVSPSRINDLQKAVICLDVRMGGGASNVQEGVRNLLTCLRYPRFLGSAALETAYVAIGRVDAFVEPRPQLRSYDCLPALYLLKKAGGCIRFLAESSEDFDMTEAHRRFAYVAAGNEELCTILLSFFGTLGGGKKTKIS